MTVAHRVAQSVKDAGREVRRYTQGDGVASNANPLYKHKGMSIEACQLSIASRPGAPLPPNPRLR